MKRFGVGNYFVCMLVSIWSLALGFPKSGFNQTRDTIFQLVDSLSITTKMMASDPIANFYLVSPTNEIIKYSPAGNEQFRYNNNTLGNLGFIDCSNPFNLLLYYPDFQSVILLDRTMNESNRMDFIEFGVPDVSQIALSNDNQIWYYDELDFKLKKINAEGQPVSQSEDLNLIFRQIPRIKQLGASGNWVFLNTHSLGLLIFDQFGQYHQSIDQEVDAFQVVSNQLILQKGQQYFQYDQKTGQSNLLPLPADHSNILDISWQQQYVFLRSPEKIYIYQF